MYTGRLMVRVHYTTHMQRSTTGVKLAAETILKIAYNQSAMSFSFFLQFGLGSLKIHLKSGSDC